MRAFLPCIVAALILCATAVPRAGAAKKKNTDDSRRPPQDSVLWIPRVAKPPDINAFLPRADHKKDRGAKVARDPGRSQAGSSRSGAAKEEKRSEPDSLPRPTGDVQPKGATLSSPGPDNSTQRPVNVAPQKSSRSDSSSTRTRAGTFTRDTSRVVAGVGALPPPGPGSPATERAAPAPEGGPPSPPPRSPPAGRGPSGWLFVVGAAVPIAWTGIGLLRARGRRNARHASRRLLEPVAGSPDRNGRGGVVSRVAAKYPGRRSSGELTVAQAAGTARAPRRSRVRRMFLSNLGRVKGSLLLAALFMVGGAAVELLKPWPLKIVLDQVILAKPPSGALSFLQGIAPNGFHLLVAAAAAIVLISVIGGLFSYLQVFITKAVGYRMVYALRREVFAHLQRLSLSFHNRARSGDLLTTFGKDTGTLKDIFAEALLKFAEHSLLMIGMLTILWLVNWKICLLAVATLPFLCYTLMHLYRQTKLSLRKQRRQEGKVVSRVNEVLGAVPLVQAFGREQYEEERYEAVSNETLRESIRMTRLEAAASRSTQIVSAIGTALAVLVGGMEVLQGRMLPGELVLVMSYITSMYKPLRSLAKLSIDLSKAAASAERIGQILEIEPEIQDRPGAIEADRVRGEIRFESVSFDYRDGKEVLHDLSFDVPPGRRVALVGASGAGKSTIASLILRLYEAQQGVILIDGVDIARYGRESLRRQIGIVLQDSVLFGATIRENIAYGKPDAGMEEIVAAARTANADEFIRELEDGYESVVGERGVTLSTGQRQRIAIARAVIRDPRILILDEPMKGLDAESETRVREALDRLMAGRTSLIITHDLQSISDVDAVLVLDDGRIVERGTYSELIARNGRYRELFDLGLPSAALTPMAR